MSVCAECGSSNPDGFRFCGSCGAALTESPAGSRRVVSILFCDVAGSTALGERLDPEALRRVLNRYHEQARLIVERHGGTVEKFIGDAVLAVFGIPRLHEDDALRAVRTAAELQQTLAGDEVEIRIGVSTGEVVTGAGQTLGSGDAFNVAARLEQAAEPGEVLIGEQTWRLVRDAVEVTELAPLALRGKRDPVTAYRLVRVEAGAAGLSRRMDGRLVGRERERRRLADAFEDVIAGRTCTLATLLGPAGVGKSRLANDFMERAAADAVVVRGRCLHYGQGITYFALGEVLDALGEDRDAVIGSSPESTQLAFRRLVEGLASERPLVIMFDDLQWAEPVLLDLIEHVADLSREAPIMLLCLARAELLDLRPAWAGGKVNAFSILLEPLAPADSAALVRDLLAGHDLEPELEERVIASAGGNPLYLEEIVAMLGDRRDGDVGIPPTIHALLQARLDQLEPAERSVLQHGAVEGQVFHRGVVAELAPDAQPVDGRLQSLVRKDLVRSSPTAFVDDEAYRFRHLLIRDTAYEALPKEVRAASHERFAGWLERHRDVLHDFDEIAGYHLEQAARYRREVDPGDRQVEEISGQAAERLTAAALGATRRGDGHAARSLFRRAADILAIDDPRRLDPLAHLVWYAFELSDMDGPRDLLGEVECLGGAETTGYATILRALVRTYADGGTVEEMRASCVEAESAFAAAGDHRGLAYVSVARSLSYIATCRAADALASNVEAVEHARVAGLDHIARTLLARRCHAHLIGGTPFAEAITHATGVRDVIGNDLLVAADLSLVIGTMRAHTGDTAGGRSEIDEGLRLAAELGERRHVDVWVLVDVERAEGNVEAAIAQIVAVQRVLTDAGNVGVRTTAFIDHAELLAADGALDEALDLAHRAERESAADDWYNIAFVRAIEAEAHAAIGDTVALDAAAAAAHKITSGTDFYRMRAAVEEILARAYASIGRSAEADEALAAARAIYEEKGSMLDLARLERQRQVT